MSKGPSPQPWQVAVSATPPPGSKTAPPKPVVPVYATAPSYTPVIPTDPKGFQQYLNDHFNAGLKVDGIIGPKTLAAAAAHGLPVPQPPPPATAPPAATQTAPAPVQQASAAPSQPEPQTTAPAEVPAAPDMSQIIAQMKAQYGYLGAALDDPSVASVLENAIAKGTPAGDPSIIAALQSTTFFQNQDKNQIGFQLASAGEQKSLVAHAAQVVQQQAAALGVNVGADRLQQIASDAAKNGWAAGSPELANAIAAEFHYQPGAQHGQIGVAESQIKQLAGQYFVPVSDSTLAQLDQQIAQGTFTPEDFRTYAIEQAKSLYASPAVSKLLDKGMTMDQIADPYRQDAAKELEISPDSIDFTQPQWMRALSVQDPTTNAPAMMSRYQWVQTLRSDPQYGWDRTENGRAAYTQMANSVVQSLGLRG